MKINITRSQVAQLYVELTNDNLKEVFIVEGDEVVETPVAPTEGTAIPAIDTSDVPPAEPEAAI